MKFSKTHEWVKVENGAGTVGISDYAQSALGDIVFIELPEVGDTLSQGSQLGTIESTKTASELYAPISGEVIEVNSELVNNPQWINESPFEKGWMVKIKVQNSSELDALMDEATYKEYVEKESH